MKSYEEMDEGDREAAADAERQARALAGTDDEGDGAGRGPATSGRRGPSRLVEGLAGHADPQRRVCTVHAVLPLDAPKVLMMDLAERVAVDTCVRVTAGIDKVFVLDGAQEGDPPRVQTDGVNIAAAREAGDVDVDRLSTNDVGAMLTHYGVEAARATIVQEVKNVFGAYGIGVDPRHLSLIADYMTFQGGYRAMNRIGIDASPSPFLKMSFETAAAFLMDAVAKGAVDELKTPSSALVVGRVAPVGTGITEVFQRLDA